VGIQKPVPMNETDHGAIALRELYGGDGSAVEAGKSFVHSATLTGMGEMRKTAELAGGASRRKQLNCTSPFEFAAKFYYRHTARDWLQKTEKPTRSSVITITL
jgi:hypothetical protein